MCRIFLYGSPILFILGMILSCLAVGLRIIYTETQGELLPLLVIGYLVMIGLESWLLSFVKSFIKEIQGGPNPEVALMVVPVPDDMHGNHESPNSNTTSPPGEMA